MSEQNAESDNEEFETTSGDEDTRKKMSREAYEEKSEELPEQKEVQLEYSRSENYSPKRQKTIITEIKNQESDRLKKKHDSKENLLFLMFPMSRNSKVKFNLKI